MAKKYEDLDALIDAHQETDEERRRRKWAEGLGALSVTTTASVADIAEAMKVAERAIQRQQETNVLETLRGHQAELDRQYVQRRADEIEAKYLEPTYTPRKSWLFPTGWSGQPPK